MGGIEKEIALILSIYICHGSIGILELNNQVTRKARQPKH